MFGMGDGSIFDHRFSHRNYNKLELVSGNIDQLYIDEDVTIAYTPEKFDGWRYNTVINAKLNGTLEAGSVTAGGLEIEKIRFQKRAWNELEWQDVAELDYIADRNIYYEAIDKNVAHDSLYQYSILPMITSTIIGNRIVSEDIVAEFDGIFISDIENNYKLMYDVNIGAIQSNIANNVFQPLNSKFPIVVHSNSDYATFDIQSTFISASTEASDRINIRMERAGKDKLMEFMKNGKPKVYRDHLGMVKIVSVVGQPQETPLAGADGIATMSFSLVEIGEFNGETLKENNLLEGLTEVF